MTPLLPTRMYATLWALVLALPASCLLVAVLLVRAIVLGSPATFGWAVAAAGLALALRGLLGIHTTRCQRWLDNARG